ncbi:MAG TPA: DinB family protein [Acidobacteriota bacterium]|jgi:uncharacterized damage-inducible protein DinB
MISKQDLIQLFQKEFATTARVMKAYPAGKDDFAPHERSSNAMRLASTFVFEMYLLEKYIFAEPIDPAVFKSYKPDNLNAIAEDFEKEGKRVISRLQELPESDLNKNVSFGGATFVADQFALMMLFDQIHHRGQLSVYVRMAGGKVPSIYGPSADDQGTNL